MHNLKNSYKYLSMLVTIIICLSMISCSSSPSSDEVYTTNVVRTDMQSYGNYIYTFFGAVYRCNRVTNEFLKACVDPECDGKCPLDGAIAETDHIEKGKLFFHSFEAYTHKVHYGYQDIVSGEVTILKTLSKMEALNYSRAFVYNDYIYYSYYILKAGGDAANAEDYIQHLCRMPIDGGKEEVLMSCDESLIAVIDNKIITGSIGTMFSYDIDCLEKKLLWKYSDHDYTVIGAFSAINDKLYFLAGTSNYDQCKYTNMKLNHNYLISLNVNTGEASRVVECPVITYSLTDDRIYYSPMVIRYLYVPDNYENHLNEIVMFRGDETLYSCNLDGTEIRQEYSNSTVDYIEDYTVVDRKLYGWIKNFNQDTNTWENEYFGTIDFETGTLTYIGERER